ncbi:RNA polymerase sigma factor [Pararoseomonas indoligenes]|uniref:RNA polymerase sigma factor n=1 Tax=Roseomonas indoligenes TaxID=2820811 RepID=A0A940N6L8_9PROT|nr:RNA polymerase sigma factor [Pararoseomonas indoligenes]MBP0495082.1 RNA polymerase sigma factor [Pararoseomonas indoligenes]
MSTLAEIEAQVPALRRYAWSLVRHDQDADDLVQDCLVRALASLPEIEGNGITPLRPWLFTILHNLAVSRWRSLRRRGQTVEPESANLTVAPSQEWTSSAREMVDALARLPPDQRQVLMLVSVEGFEYREAAGILGIPMGTVMSRLSRARDALRAQMEGRGRLALRLVQ